jgi:hypothetical protein
VTPSLLTSPDVTAKLAEWQKGKPTAAQLREALFKAQEQHKRPAVLAALKALADAGALVSLLKDDSRFYLLLADRYRHERRLDDLKNFHLSFAQPRFLKELVRLLLTVSLQLTEDESAHVGVELVNVMRQRGVKLEHWAYYDVATGTYKWL